jgi:hypothetical protein
VIAHPFREGERVHFAHESEMEIGLRHGYLELLLVGDGGFMHRVVRYQPQSNTYHWYEAPMGYAPGATKRHTYGNLEELLKEHDLHAYAWYPLQPKGHSSSFDYHGLLSQFSHQYPTWDQGEKAG